MKIYIDGCAFYDELQQHKEKMKKDDGCVPEIIAETIELIQRRLANIITTTGVVILKDLKGE